MECEGLSSELYSFFVLGTLQGEELSEVRLHISQDCVRCRSEIVNAGRLWNGFAAAIPVIEPRRALRGRVIASVRDPEKSGSRVLWWQWAAGFSAIVLATFVGWQASRLPTASPVVATVAPVEQTNRGAVAVVEEENRRLREELARAGRQNLPSQPARRETAVPATPAPDSAELAGLRSEVASLQVEVKRQQGLATAASRAVDEANRKYLAAVAQPKSDTNAEAQRQLAVAQARVQQLDGDLVQYKALLATARTRVAAPQNTGILSDPNLRLVRLRSTERDSTVQGHALLASGSQVVFYASGLPALAPGRVYQLWLIRGQAPAIVSAGVFQPDSARKANVQFAISALTADVTGIAVTDEPAGGSRTPTGHKLLIGS